MFTEIAVAAGLPSGRELSLSAPVREPGVALLHSLRCRLFPPATPLPVHGEAKGVPQETATPVPTQAEARRRPAAPFRWLWQALEERRKRREISRHPFLEKA